MCLPAEPRLVRAQTLSALRGIVFDSLAGAGRRDIQTFDAVDDSATNRITPAEMPFTPRDAATMPTCSGSATADPLSVASTHGCSLRSQ